MRRFTKTALTVAAIGAAVVVARKVDRQYGSPVATKVGNLAAAGRDRVASKVTELRGASTPL